ncbi:MAG: hypothetical protein A3F12_06560 [Gammaproteobacteria bacterium RIFCSPHIGHO2_12_FULL_38_14]|nr:MAG: hypothetical protein A3F12_06560 [Gammaproteobacteria bacterium RIFCSPHIGHO2_12_FULL_38_14]
MKFQRFTHYLLEHRYLTIVLAFLITFIPVLGAMSIIAAAFITLRKGAVEGAILTFAATLPYVISFYFSHHTDTSTITVWAAILVAVSSNTLTWIFAVLLNRRCSWSQLFQIAALAGVLFVSVIHLLYPDVAVWWGEQLRSYYTEAKAVANSLSQSDHLELINNTKQYATGFMTAGVLFNAILQLIIARWWESYIFYPGRLHKELQNVHLSQLAGILFIASLVFSYLGNIVVLDIMPILYLLFGVAGLSIVHYFFRQIKTSTSWFWLMIFYLAMVISLPASIIFVSMISLADIWFNVRKRFKKIS